MFMFLFFVVFFATLLMEQFFVEAITETQAKLPIVRNWRRFEEVHAASMALNLVFGLFVGVAISKFGGGVGAGATAFAAAMLANVSSVPFAKAMLWYKEEARPWYDENQEKVRQTFKDFVHFCWITMRIITWPIRAARWCVNQCNIGIEKYHVLKSNLTATGRG